MSLGLGHWLLALGTPLALGAGLLAALGLGPRSEPFGFWGWAWCSGALLFALAIHLAAWFGLPWDPILLAPPALFSAFALFALARLRSQSDRPIVLRPVEPGPGYGRGSGARRGAPRRPSAPAAALGLVCVLGSLSALDRTLWADVPVPAAGGAPVTWGARLLAEAGDYGPGYRAELRRHSLDWGELRPAVQRPLDPAPLGPALGAWVQRVAGEPVPFAAAVPTGLFAPALLAVAAAALGRAVGGWIAVLLLGALAVCLPGAASPLFQEGRVPAAAAGLLLGLDGWRRYRTSGEGRWALLSAIGLGVAATASSEGAALVAGILVLGPAAAVFARRRRAAPPLSPQPLRQRFTGAAVWAAGASAAALVAAAALRTGAGPDWAGLDGAPRPFPVLLLWQGGERWAAAVGELITRLFLDGSHGGFLPLALLIVAPFLPRASTGISRWPEAALLSAAALFLLIAIGSPRSEPAALADLAASLWLLVPAAGLLLAERLKNVQPRAHASERLTGGGA